MRSLPAEERAGLGRRPLRFGEAVGVATNPLEGVGISPNSLLWASGRGCLWGLPFHASIRLGKVCRSDQPQSPPPSPHLSVEHKGGIVNELRRSMPVLGGGRGWDLICRELAVPELRKGGRGFLKLLLPPWSRSLHFIHPSIQFIACPSYHFTILKNKNYINKIL